MSNKKPRSMKIDDVIIVKKLNLINNRLLIFHWEQNLLRLCKKIKFLRNCLIYAFQ